MYYKEWGTEMKLYHQFDLHEIMIIAYFFYYRHHRA